MACKMWRQPSPAASTQWSAPRTSIVTWEPPTSLLGAIEDPSSCSPLWDLEEQILSEGAKSFTKLKVTPEDRLQRRTVEQIAAEVIQPIPQKRISVLTCNQVVDVPVPQVHETVEAAETITWQCLQQRTEQQIAHLPVLVQ